MTRSPPPATREFAATPGAAGGRLVGVDVARGLALLGMMSVHMLSAEAAGADAIWSVTQGRSAALFAVLAGVSVALASGRDRPGPWWPTAAGLLGRAAVIGVVGLSLGIFPGRVAVILVNYALLFVAACVFLRLSARALAGAAAAWLTLAPVCGFVLRQALPSDADPGPGPVPSWMDLVRPVDFMTDLLLTGYYPVLTWLGYVLVGMAIGRSHRFYRAWDAKTRTHSGVTRGVITRTDGRAGWWLVGLGAALVAGAGIAASQLDTRFGVTERLTLPAAHPSSRDESFTSLYGTTPTDSWWWLLTEYRHSGTPFDLVGTTGSALAVIGICLLITRFGAVAVVLQPLAVAGSMPLTLYTLHVLIEAVRAEYSAGGDSILGWLVEAAVLIVLAVALRAGGRAIGGTGRGPLEWVAATASQAARQAAQPTR